MHPNPILVLFASYPVAQCPLWPLDCDVCPVVPVFFLPPSSCAVNGLGVFRNYVGKGKRNHAKFQFGIFSPYFTRKRDALFSPIESKYDEHRM